MKPTNPNPTLEEIRAYLDNLLKRAASNKKPKKRYYLARLVILTQLFVSCGTASNPGPTTGDTTATTPQVSKTVAPIASLPQANTSTALALENLSKAPNCDSSNESQLIYVKDTKSFMDCESGKWTKIDMPVAVAQNGKDGISGKDGKDLRSNYWIDPITNYEWYQGAASVSSPGNCGPGFTFDGQKVSDAIRDGMLSAITTSQNYVWTSSGLYKASNSAIAAPLPSQIGTIAALYCVKIN